MKVPVGHFASVKTSRVEITSRHKCFNMTHKETTTRRSHQRSRKEHLERGRRVLTDNLDCRRSGKIEMSKKKLEPSYYNELTKPADVNPSFHKAGELQIDFSNLVVLIVTLLIFFHRQTEVIYLSVIITHP